MVKNSAQIVPVPAHCAGVSLPKWAPALVFRMELLAWWELTVPRSLRTRRTDYLASRVLHLSADPSATVRAWIAVGEYRPWLLVERGLSYLRSLDEYRANPGQFS